MWLCLRSHGGQPRQLLLKKILRNQPRDSWPWLHGRITWGRGGGGGALKASMPKHTPDQLNQRPQGGAQT